MGIVAIFFPVFILNLLKLSLATQPQYQQMTQINPGMETYTLQEIQMQDVGGLQQVTPPTGSRIQSLPTYGRYQQPSPGHPSSPPTNAQISSYERYQSPPSSAPSSGQISSYERYQPAPALPPPPPPPAQVPAAPAPPISPAVEQEPTSDQNVLERLTQFCTPGENFDVGRLNFVMNRVGRELHFLSEKSRECLYDKVRSLAQLKRMREGLKNAYKDIYNLQGSLSTYQNQLKDMQEYLKSNKERIVVVDNKKLGEMYSMVRRLQSTAENMVANCMRSQQPEPAI